MRPTGRATVSPRSPHALAICDRCGARYNLVALNWQYQWSGVQLRNIRILVCDSCLDTPQQQLRTIVLPPDPVPVANPRPEFYVQDDAPIQGLGSNIGTMAQGGGLAAAFNSVLQKPSMWCASQYPSSVGVNTIGKRWNTSITLLSSNAQAQTVNVTRFTMYAPYDGKFLGSGAAAFSFQGSSDNSTWNTLYSANTAGTTGESIDVTSSQITSAPYSYHRLAITGDGATPVNVAQLVIYGTGLSVVQ